MVLKQKRDNTDVLIVDASKGFEKVGKNNVLRACDIKKIVDVIVSRENVSKFSKLVSREEIRQNDYNLNIPRYVDSSEKAESWDIYSSMFGGIPESELRDLSEYWDAFPNLKNDLFRPINSDYCELKVDDLKSTVQNHSDILSFYSKYSEAFDDFGEFLDNELIAKMQVVNTARAESVLSDNIFERLRNIPLVNRYDAYQLLDKAWQTISIDLEIIQTEGVGAIKQVDPHMVIKKKGKDEEEVQDGWVGHVLQFELVEKELLAEERAELDAIDNRLSEIAGEKESLFDELSEEDKEKPFASEDGFVPAELKKAIKDKDAEPEVIEILKEAQKLILEEKDLKQKLKTGEAELHIKTKELIEALSDEQAVALLRTKWINPLVSSILALPQSVTSDFVSKLEAICTKYDTTLSQVEEEIKATEQSLGSLLDDLQGNEFDLKGLAELKSLLGGA